MFAPHGVTTDAKIGLIALKLLLQNNISTEKAFFPTKLLSSRKQMSSFYSLNVINSQLQFALLVAQHTACPEKRDQNIFRNISDKTRAILMKFDTVS